MRSGYREIGEFVQQVNIRNTGLAVTNLQGISINKYFMPSVANINGTDLAKYKVVKQKQFAFNPMHVGRDEVLPIAMLDNDDSVIVSPAYVVFEVIDKKALLPEYLMMWCSRPEFDRNAWFTTDSSVRGGFSWDDFCALTLPVPSLEKQQKIVKEYQVIVDRIKLNERISQKLEETAQAIYKHWFVDFEFPMSAEYAASIGKPELEGQPYKSSGGEMVFNEVLEMEIPKGWDVASIDTVFSMRYGKNLPTNQLSETGYDVFGGNGLIGRYAEYMYEDKQVALACRGAASGEIVSI
jgi:type I restriction enzyme, S subunit